MTALGPISVLKKKAFKDPQVPAGKGGEGRWLLAQEKKMDHPPPNPGHRRTPASSTLDRKFPSHVADTLTDHTPCAHTHTHTQAHRRTSFFWAPFRQFWSTIIMSIIIFIIIITITITNAIVTTTNTINIIIVRRPEFEQKINATNPPPAHTHTPGHRQRL